MNDKSYTWGVAVEWIRKQPVQAELVKPCNYSDYLFRAADRFTKTVSERKFGRDNQTVIIQLSDETKLPSSVF